MLAAGGCPFPCAPDLPAEDAPALWAPHLDASTVRLEAAPADEHRARPLDPVAIGPILADRTLTDGRHLVIGDRHGLHRLWITERDPCRPVVIAIATGIGVLHRAAAAYRLARRIGGLVAGPVPAGLAPTRLQRRRLVQLLSLIDASTVRSTRRELATILYPAMRAYSSREWAASTERRNTQRALDRARALVAGGYRTLLAGT